MAKRANLRLNSSEDLSIQKPPKVWLNGKQLRGHRGNIVAAIKSNEDGATLELPLAMGRALLNIIDQAIHTEEAHNA